MNNGIMGDLISNGENHNHEISINAGDTINRVELYRNNILEDAYIHSRKLKIDGTISCFNGGVYF